MSIARMLMGVQSGPAINWDLSFANEPEPLTTYAVSAVNNVGSFDVSAYINDVYGVFIKPDGTKLYIAGENDKIVEFSLSIPFDVTTATFSDDFSTTIQTGDPRDIFISADGTRLYTVDTSESVYQYAMSTAWDLSTISYVRSYSAAATLAASAQGIFFKPDGAKMYVTGGSVVYEFALSTAWNISTASFTTSLAIGFSTESIAFTDDGSAFFVVDGAGAGRKITMSTPWDISTGSSSTVNFPTDITGDSDGICFAKGGQILLIAFDGTTGAGAVGQYSCATYDGFSVSSEESNPTGIFFRDNGTKMYIVGSSGDDVNEYTLSTAWDETTATFVTSFSVATEETAPTGIFFKSDGTKMYVCGTAGDDVNQYAMSTPWSVATATYERNFLVTSQGSNPQAVSFSADGSKMYVITTSNVHEYDLATPWDIQFVSFVQSFSFSSQDTVGTGIFFKDDGAKMYITGTQKDRIHEYELSTPWDISTASLSYSIFNGYVETAAQSIFFRPDGLFFYIVGTAGDKVFKYSISA